MASHRRRHHERCGLLRSYSGVTLIAAACFLIAVVIVAFLSFLAPPLVDRSSFPNRPFRRLQRSSLLLKNAVQVKNKAVHDEIFLVPSGGEVEDNELWGSKMSKYFYGCSNASKKFQSADEITQPDRYLMIATSGGLNQQRTGITDAVAAARILNVTLVVPSLDQKSFWKDSSNFTEIFDVDWFISSLSTDVKIIKQLPEKIGKVVGTPYRMRVPRKCSANCYRTRVLPVLMKKHAVQLTKFDYRLSNKLPKDFQKLRCRVNYHALRFTDQILEMGETLIQRMKAKSKRFIALHLRFEPDMLAFSGCYYGGGEKEKKELGAIRKRWKTLHASNPEKARKNGRCPLTPEEVGLTLRALGFGKDVNIYMASGEVYGGEETLASLKTLFPNFYSKESLASKEELAPFSSFSSRMAALDFIVCDGSDVFVTNNNGNMARMLAGRRRYFGHKRTIRPNAKKLHSLFSNRTQMTWDVFASKVQTFQKGFIGEPNEVKPGSGEFHENPYTCICEKSIESGSKIPTKVGNINGKNNISGHSSDQELDLLEVDYGKNVALETNVPNRVESEFPEPEEMISD